MNRPISKFSIDPNLIIGKWEGIFFKINIYTGNIEEAEINIEFYSDYTTTGNLGQYLIEGSNADQFRWFPFNNSIEIIISIQGNYLMFPLALFKVDEVEMSFHHNGCFIFKGCQEPFPDRVKTLIPSYEVVRDFHGKGFQGCQEPFPAEDKTSILVYKTLNCFLVNHFGT